MKIAILYSHLKELGGAERVILKQAELFHHKHHDVECLFAYVDKNLQRNLGSLRCRTSSFITPIIPNQPAIRILSSIPLALSALSTFKSANALICHGYGPAPWIGYLNKKTNGAGYISYIHSPPRFLYLDSQQRDLWKFNDFRRMIFKIGKFAGPMLKEIDYLSVVNSDSVLANSQFTAKRIRTVYGITPQICYPPVDTQSFTVLPQKCVKDFRASLGWPIILSTGRIVAVKRWEWLLDIMSHVVRDFRSAVLAITGEITGENAKYVGRLQKMSRKLGIERNVKFLGFQSQTELVKLYNAADVYAYSVPHEDFGLGPVEAMACGTPSIVWDDGGGPCETVIDGETGFRARPYDMEDFAEKTSKAIEFDKSEISARTRTFVESRFSSEKHFEILEQAVRRLA